MTLREKFWETVPLGRMTREEWEALCDGCAKCCLIKLTDEETGNTCYTDVACRLLDRDTCRCSDYGARRQIVPGCVLLDMTTLEQARHWLPSTCAYRRLAEGKPLPRWHPLICGDPERIHLAGLSMIGRTVPEETVHDDDLEDHIIWEEEP